MRLIASPDLSNKPCINASTVPTCTSVTSSMRASPCEGFHICRDQRFVRCAGQSRAALPSSLVVVLIAFIGSRFGQFPKHFGVEYNDRPVLEANPITRCPGSQLLVDAFPAHSDHFADFLLGDGDGSASRRQLVFLGQA